MSDTGLAGRSVEALRSSARELEREVTVLRFRQLEVYAELHERGFEALGFRGLPDLIRADLRCSRSVARSLATEVERFVGRNAVGGEPLDPVYPVVASVLSSGVLGFEHARIIGDVIEKLPVDTQLRHATEVETILVEQTIELALEPESLRTLAKRVIGHLDPDGPEPKEEVQRRRRRVELAQHFDGSGFLSGELTAECLAIWQAVLTALAARCHTTGDDGTGSTDELGRDTRTTWQRMHDAFEEAGRLLLEGGKLPDHAGLPAQLLITIDLKDLEARIGQATTHHGGTLTVQQALHLAAEATVIPVILDQELGLIEHGRGKRLASEKQRAVVFARDRGCTFPGCGTSAANSQVHHMLDWLYLGETNPDNLTITCGYHNNEAPRMGWKATMIDGFPHWTPPAWIDPQQKPRRNYLHHPELLLRR